MDEINIIITKKEQMRKEEAQQAKSEAKERQMKLRADAKARRANEIATRRQLENMRIGVDTRASHGESDLSVKGSELTIGVPKQQSPQQKQSPQGQGHSPSGVSRGELSSSPKETVKKSPLAQQLAMQLEQIQAEQEMERLASISICRHLSAGGGEDGVGWGKRRAAVATTAGRPAQGRQRQRQPSAPSPCRKEGKH